MPQRILAAVALSAASIVGFSSSAHADADAFTMQIMDAFAISGRGTVMTGRVETGAIESGDTVCVPTTSGETLSRKVEGIEQFRKIMDRAEAGQMVGILVTAVNSKEVEKGAELNSDCEPAEQGTEDS